MKYPRKRVTTALGATETGFSRYRSLDDSVRDLLLWFEEFNLPLEVNGAEEYAAILKNKGYYEDTYQNYLNGMLNALKVVS